MFFRRRFGRRRIYRKVGLRKRSGGRRKVSKSVKSYVKKAIHRQLENKEVLYYSANNAITTCSNTVPTGKQALPAIGQGTGNSGRIGECIKIVKGTIKGIVNLLPYDATNNPLSTAIWVRVMLLRNITYSAQLGLSDSTMANEWTALFKTNTNTNIGFTNSPCDMFLPINDAKWRVLGSRVFKLGAASATSAGKVGTGGYYDNSPMAKAFSFNIGKFTRKQLKYDTTTLYPSNDNAYLIFQAVNADGSATAVQVAEYHYQLHCKYEDA